MIAFPAMHFGGTSFDILSLSPTLWLRGDLGLLTTGGAPVTSDGQPITQISDQSGNGNHAVQGGAAADSIAAFNVQNGKTVVRNATGGWFNLSSIDLGASHTIFAVGKTTNALMMLGGQATESFAFHNPPDMYYSNKFSVSSTTFPETWASPAVKAFRRAGTTIRAYNNGLPIPGVSGAVDQTLGSNDHFFLTNLFSYSSAGNFNWTGDLDELIIFPTALSDLDFAIVTNYLLVRWGLDNLRNVVCDGNSITFGVGGTPYPQQMANLLGTNYNVGNFGVSGLTTAELVSRFAASVQPYLIPPKTVLIVFEGINSMTPSIGNLSPAAAYNDMISYIANAKAVGSQVRLIVCTMPDTSRVSEPNQTTYNNLVRANSAGADYVLDIRADSRLANVADGTYFSDDAHLTTAGYGVIAELAAPVVPTLF